MGHAVPAIIIFTFSDACTDCRTWSRGSEGEPLLARSIAKGSGLFLTRVDRRHIVQTSCMSYGNDVGRMHVGVEWTPGQSVGTRLLSYEIAAPWTGRAGPHI